MFDVSLAELAAIMVVILILFGPDKLPEMAKKAGYYMSKFRRTSDGLRREFYNAVYAPTEEVNRRLQEEARTLIGLKDEELASKNCPEEAAIKESQEPKDKN